jgi:hypothetical protein
VLIDQLAHTNRDFNIGKVDKVIVACEPDARSVLGILGSDGLRLEPV